MRVVTMYPFPIRFVTICFALLWLSGCQQSAPQPEDTPPAASPNSAGTPSAQAPPVVAPGPEPPDVVVDWVHRPQVFTVLGDATGGTCFTAKTRARGETLMFTSLSTLCREGGLRSDVSTSGLEDMLLGIDLLPLGRVAPSKSFPAAPLITLPAAKLGFGSAAGDVAVLRLPDVDLPSGKFAVNPPRKGDIAWLVSESGDPSNPTPRFLQVEIVASGEPPPESGQRRRLGSRNDNLMRYGIVDSWSSWRGLLGAPLLNEYGEVIAIHSQSQLRDGVLWGFGTPTTRFLPLVERSLANELPGEVVHKSGFTLPLPKGYTQSGSAPGTWVSTSAHNEEVKISLQVGPNKRNYQSSRPELKKLLDLALDKLVGGRSHSRSANGQFLRRSGLSLMIGNYSVGSGAVFGREARSGIAAVGVTDEHLVLASFQSPGRSEGTVAYLLAQRALKNLTREGEPLSPRWHREFNPNQTTRIEIVDLDDADLYEVVTGLTGMFRAGGGEYSGLSMNTASRPLVMRVESPLEIEELARRIRLGREPEIDPSNRLIRYELGNKNASQEPAGLDGYDEMVTRLIDLESRDWRRNTEQALKFLVETQPSRAPSNEIRQRVAKQLADYLTDSSTSSFVQKDIIEVIVGWDAEIARPALMHAVKTTEWPNPSEALQQLISIADESVMEVAAHGLLHDKGGHARDPALQLLRKYPQESQTLLLGKITQGDYLGASQAKNGIDLLVEFGEKESLAAFRNLDKTNLDPAVREAMEAAIVKLARKLGN